MELFEVQRRKSILSDENYPDERSLEPFIWKSCVENGKFE